MNYYEISNALTESLGLEYPPVSITFTKEIPPGAGRLERTVPAGCRFWQDGRTHTFATAAADHASCAIGMYTHNLAQQAPQSADLADALAIFSELGYVTEADLPLIPVLKFQPEYVLYGPLADSIAAPAVVVMFVDAAQALIASEAAQQVENRVLPAMGRPACAVIPLVANTGMAAISLGCCGARAYLDTFTPNLSIFAIPGDKLERYVERIRILAAANSTLKKFHHVRATQVGMGLAPTIKESLVALKAG